MGDSELKRTRGEERLSELGEIVQWADAKGATVRYGKTTLYNKLRQRSYEWDARQQQWTKRGKGATQNGQ